MLLTHEREFGNATQASVSVVGPSDLPSTGTPSIFVRVKQDEIVSLIRRGDSFYSLDNDELFTKLIGYLNFHLQNEYPSYFVAIAKGSTNIVKVKNAFKLLDNDSADIDRTDFDSPQNYNHLRSTVELKIKQHIQNIYTDSQNLRSFIAKTSLNEKWDGFIKTREKFIEQEVIAEALIGLNEKLKPYYLDGEFLSLDQYSSVSPGIYYYDYQCRPICTFNLMASSRMIETVIQKCSEISLSGEKSGMEFYKRNADVFTENDFPSLQDISIDYIRIAYHYEISIYVALFHEALLSINADESHLLVELAELVINRFHNGFLIGHFSEQQKHAD